MRTAIVRMLMVGSAACCLAACGGGGGGGAGLSSTPPPPPPPPQTSTTPVIFPNVTTTTQFATLGYESPSNAIQTGSLVGSGFSVSYDAVAKNYVIDVPASVPGVFQAYQTGERYWNGQLRDPAGGLQPVFLNVFRPGPQNWDFANLTYTTFAEYGASDRLGNLAFGQATPVGAVPVAGTATYEAFAAGYAEGGAGLFAIRGDVQLQFNFAAGTLSGAFNPYIYDLLSGNTPLGHYDFVNTLFGVGSTTFSGELSRTGVAQHGTFDGLFTGPNAQELMARWTAPLPDPSTGTTSQMFGVWVGKKCC